MEILSSNLIAATLPAPSTAPLDVSAGDAQRFALLMQESAVQPPAPSTVTPTAMELAPTSGPLNVGERILAGMQNVSQDLQSKWGAVQQTLQNNGPELTMQDMLRLQMHLTQASVQYEVLGKAISKSTQNFDQLVRVQ